MAERVDRDFAKILMALLNIVCSATVCTTQDSLNFFCTRTRGFFFLQHTPRCLRFQEFEDANKIGEKRNNRQTYLIYLSVQRK